MARLILRKQLLFLALSFLCVFLSWIGWWFHYSGRSVGNHATWVFWIFSIVFCLLSVSTQLLVQRWRIKSGERLLFIGLTGMFILAHASIFSHAPWNTYGLFDDAAWDIYFAYNHVFSGVPFQAAFFDSIGFISREVVFHYYITILFHIFGYNLFVFTMGLQFLGYITLFGLVFLVQRLFNKYMISALIGMLVIFWPLFYMQIYMGHRYAIAVPLLVCSLVFLYSGFRSRTDLWMIISALFAALCVGSSVMGKQLLYALVFSCGVSILSINGRSHLMKYRRHIGVWIIGFIIAATPLLAYIIADPSIYSLRETGLVREFMSAYQNQGIVGIFPYWNGLVELFTAPFSGRRQFMLTFPVIPLAYVLLIIPGLFLQWKHRRYELIAISILPIAGSFVSGAYDFRVLFAFPGWVLACAYTLDYVFGLPIQKWSSSVLTGLVCSIVIVGYVPAIKYIYDMAGNPNSQYLLQHADVATARLVQDIAAGEEHPRINMKWNEFNRSLNPDRPYDLLVAPANAYAIMHLYLQKFDDKKILSFSDGGIQRLMSQQELFLFNKRAVLEYQSQGKDLKLIWERTEKSTHIRDIFKTIAQRATLQTLAYDIDGNHITLDILTIPSNSIDAFKTEVQSLPEIPILPIERSK